MIPQRKTELESPVAPPTRNYSFELAPSTMLNIVLVVAGLWLLFKLVPVFLVLIAAFFIVETLNPLVNWMEAKGMGRVLSISIVFVLLLVMVVVTAIFTVPALLAQASSILDQEPVLRTQLADKLSGFPFSDALSQWLRNFKYSGTFTVASATTFSMEALGFITYALGAVFLALYMMIDRDQMRGGLYAIVPRSHHIRLSRVMMNLQTIVGAYIRGQVITSLSIGLFILVLLYFCGVENALALAVFGSIADILPYIGIFLPMGAAVLSAAPHGAVITLVVLGGMFLYMEFESRILVPRVYGHALRLPSTVVLISLLAGGTLMGIVGALLALPFAAAVMMLIEELRVQLPGVQEQVADEVLREKDDRGEKEYERRAEGASAEKSAAIAVEISGDRVKEEIESLKNAENGESIEMSNL